MDFQHHLEKALSYLSSIQKPSGEFPTYTFSSLIDTDEVTPVSTTYITSNVLHSLSYSNHPLVKKLIEKGINFLKKEMHPKMDSLNYWPRKSSEFKNLPLPDDFDVSFCAYAAMEENKHHFGEKIFPYLIARDSSEGGPYYTWLTTTKRWDDIELGVNTNILWFCNLNEIYLPETIKFIYMQLKSSKLTTQYFPPISNLYLIARMIHDGKLLELEEKRKKEEEIEISFKDLIREVKRNLKKENVVPTPLGKILLLLTKLKLDLEKVSQTDMEEILQLQNPNGSWSGSAFSASHKDILGQKGFDGSSALTTALAIELLGTYQKQSITKSDFYFPEYEVIYEKIRKIALKKDFGENKSQKELSRNLLRTISNQKFTTQSALRPMLLLESLDITQDLILKEIATELGANNITGWGYYYIEDEVLDTGLKDKNMLKLMDEYRKDFFETIRKHVDKNAWDKIKSLEKIYEKTLTWEISKCRFRKDTIRDIPNYGDFEILADRSAPFYYASIALMNKLRIEQQKILTITQFIRNFLITKQLNDDMTDWEEDLKNGHINSVASVILDKLGKKTVKLENKTFEEMRSIFWEKVIDIIVREVEDRVQEARKLSRVAFVHPQIVYDVLFDGIEESAKKALRERNVVLGMIRQSDVYN